MTAIESKLLEIVGEDVALKLSHILENKKMPGKKFRNRVMRERFLAEFKGKEPGEFARKYGVSRATIYNWLKKESPPKRA